MMMLEMKTTEFLEELSSKAPVPGGGGASAAVGAFGAALGMMVANLTVGKKKYAAVEEEILADLEELGKLRDRLVALTDRDAQAFEPLSKAYAIPKDDPNREAVMEQCLRDAAATPMEILRLSCQAIDLHREMLDKGSVMMLSDVGTGVVFCQSALQGAALNVRVNTKSMTDRAFAQAMDEEVDALVEKYSVIARQVYDAVMGRFV